MSMRNSNTSFYGIQDGERIFYVVRPHSLATTFALIKVYLIAIVISVVLLILGSQFSSLAGIFAVLALIFFLLIIIFGTKIVLDWQTRNISYITDRRLVHFEPTTLFATNSRTLAWDEVVKVKTYPSNFIWKQLAIGKVVVHARTSIRTADDIEIENVYFYRDLGNYIDKILYTYKQMPKEVANIRPFVLKPRGQRF